MSRHWKCAVLLGQAVRQELPLWAICQNCQHQVQLNAQSLAERHGDQWSVAFIATRLHCRKCGGHNAQIALSPSANMTGADCESMATIREGSMEVSTMRSRKSGHPSALSSIELCAGAGGQAIGLEAAGFEHHCLVEIDNHCCDTLRLNRPKWDVRQEDLVQFSAAAFKGIDLLAAGLPCPPFSIAGKQLGAADERNLFPAALRIVDETRPKAVMIENVRGFLDAVFEDYRKNLKDQLAKLGYKADWHLLNASDFGVPQLRPRVVIVAIKHGYDDGFGWPEPSPQPPMTVGETLYSLMAANGWKFARAWRERANDIAPTLVGGSKKHGGPDLGPTRARKAWASLGVDGLGLWDAPPPANFVGSPRLTVEMCARLQGFPETWKFAGRKTAAYRQVGNAFPPPVARAVAFKLRESITERRSVLKIA